MIDLHTHTFWSDGDLAPAELVRRCQVQGYRALAITDHADPSNLGMVVTRLAEFCEAVQGAYEEVEVIPGCEITHVPPVLIGKMVDEARDMGAEIVLVHGETLVEPVAPGTNRAAIQAGADVVAHPGLISVDDVDLAAQNGVLLEISGRQGHSLSNGHVARLAIERGAGLSFGSDGHTCGDYPTRQFALTILRAAGLSEEQAEEVLEHNARFFSSAGQRQL
jgi:putative hydrolase